MSPYVGIFFLLIILVIAGVTMSGDSDAPGDEMAAAPATDGRPVAKCTIRFYTTTTVPTARDPAGQTSYCVSDGRRKDKCEDSPLAAIIAANEMPDTTRCDKVAWEFGCEKGLLCGLQQSGPNLVSTATADKIAQKQCKHPWPRLWC